MLLLPGFVQEAFISSRILSEVSSVKLTRQVEQKNKPFERENLQTWLDWPAPRVEDAS